MQILILQGVKKMRQKLIALCTVFLLLLVVNPAWAEVNLSINGNSYRPATAPQLENGTTMVPLYVLGRVLGAETSVADKVITIKKGSQTLNLLLNDTKAALNGESSIVPQAPILVNDDVMVPLRFACEAFGATVGWDQISQTATVQFSEQRQGMSVEDLLLKSSEAMLQYNTYKTKMNIGMDMEMLNPANQEESVELAMNMDMDMAMQQEPLLMYGKVTMDSPAIPEDPISATTEMLINEDGMFMTMPGQEGWISMSIPGMDMAELIKQSNNNDPLASLQMMQESGAIMSFGDDQQKDGQSYWVINVTLGAENFNKLFEGIMGQMPAVPMEDGQDLEQALTEMIQAMFKNMEADIFYRVWVEQASLLPIFMDLDARIDLDMPATTVGDEVTEPITMHMIETASYEIYDLGEPIAVPDVSEAQDLNEYLKQQMADTRL